LRFCVGQFEGFPLIVDVDISVSFSSILRVNQPPLSNLMNDGAEDRGISSARKFLFNFITRLSLSRVRPAFT